VNPVELLKDHSELLWNLPASRISTLSEEMTESPETTGHATANTIMARIAEPVLQCPITANERSPRFKALVLGSPDICITVEIRVDTRLTHYWL